MAKRRSDDDDFDDDDFDDDEDDDDEDDDDRESFDAIEWLTGDVEGFELPATWDDWIDFDWDSYDGEYEEYAVSADYE